MFVGREVLKSGFCMCVASSLEAKAMDAMELSAIQSERHPMAANSDIQTDYPMELQDGDHSVDARKPPLSHKEPPEEQVKMLPSRSHS